jgi:hypothetical protein
MAPVTGAWVTSGNVTVLELAPAQVEPGPDSPLHKLYCPATARFYPDVLECSQQWWRVLPNEGATPAPSAPQGSGPAWLPPSATQSVPGNARAFNTVASLSSTDAVLVDIDFGSILPTYGDVVNVAPGSASDQAARNSATSQVGMRKIPAPPMLLPR